MQSKKVYPAGKEELVLKLYSLEKLLPFNNPFTHKYFIIAFIVMYIIYAIFALLTWFVPKDEIQIFSCFIVTPMIFYHWILTYYLLKGRMKDINTFMFISAGLAFIGMHIIMHLIERGQTYAYFYQILLLTPSLFICVAIFLIASMLSSG